RPGKAAVRQAVPGTTAGQAARAGTELYPPGPAGAGRNEEDPGRHRPPLPGEDGEAHPRAGPGADLSASAEYRRSLPQADGRSQDAGRHDALPVPPADAAD